MTQKLDSPETPIYDALVLEEGDVLAGVRTAADQVRQVEWDVSRLHTHVTSGRDWFT